MGMNSCPEFRIPKKNTRNTQKIKYASNSPPPPQISGSTRKLSLELPLLDTGIDSATTAAAGQVH